MKDYYLVESCLKQNKKTEWELFEKYYGKFLSITNRYVKNVDEAKDVLQDAFIKLFENLNKFDFKGSFEGWCKRLIVNHCLDYLRTKKEAFVPFEDGVMFVEEDVDEELAIGFVKNIPVETIFDCINELSPAYKKIFNMYVLDYFSHKEIAKELGISENTSKTNYMKAKINLLKIITKKGLV